MARRRVHYVLSAHWDREWYRPMQHYRRDLARLLDAVLDGMAAGRLRGPFTTDGQAIMLEDYLEARPGRRAEVEARAREGMLVVGPWYTVPDEFLVSGESLVRNLRYGREVARRLGAEPSRAGWVCDQFGHVGQLPQIFAGFGLQGAFLWRGTNYSASRHFSWRGADGTALPTYRFGRGGYCAFAFQVRQADVPGARFEREEAWERLETFLAEEAAATAAPPLLAFDGADHLAWDEAAYAVVDAYGRWADAPFELAHSSLDAYLDELLPHAGAFAHEIEGELREPARPARAENEHWLIPGVLSSRAPLKQANAACECLLTQWAEPFGAWAALELGRPYERELLELPWRWLLQNHPHDSLGGCSVDLVHEDMRYRFSQCRQIAGLLAEEATGTLAAAAAGAPAEGELRAVVFNPLPEPLDETVELTLDLPTAWASFAEFFGYERLPAFRVFGPDGAELPYQRLGQELGAIRLRLDPLKFPRGEPVNAVRVSLPLRLPAMGYAALTVRAGDRDPLPPHQADPPIALPTRHPGFDMATSERSMSNGLLDVTVEANGTLSVADRRTGAVYAGLLAFEDGADIGDGWFHGPAAADEVYSSVASAASVALAHDGPFLTTFRVRTTMRVPARFDATRGRRSDELVALELDSLVSLRPGADRVEVETTVRNLACDHRLRVLLPSGAGEATTYLADGAFDVVERPVALRADNHLYRELEVEGRPQQSWTAVAAGGRGLAVVAPGQLETAVRDLPARPIALTLFRATGRTVFTDGEPGGQLLGETLRFRYWLVPLAGEPDRARLCRLGQQLAAGVRASQVAGGPEGSKDASALAASASFLRVEGPAVLTSVELAGDELELRLFNPEDTEARARLDVPARFTKARRVNLEGDSLGPEERVAGGSVMLTLKKKEIVTLRLAAEGGP
ncbi:MAG TPA: glycoside hydrolase family 38 C-terminal domain-containing protein [Chloroflexaceae bacterium]|nr:glycoside hydrolase family 38 C-terminal domain-containing protein [Chloroflexaceae bacterium]